MRADVIVTLPFTRAVYAHELRPGDRFTFPDTPGVTLLVTHTSPVSTAPGLDLLRLVLFDLPPLYLPANTLVRPMRMVRTCTLTCLLCRTDQDIEVDLPHAGEPLALVCADHLRGSAPEPLR